MMVRWQRGRMLEATLTPRGFLGEHLLKESEGGKFPCMLDLAPRAAAYAAVDYTDPT